MKIQIQIHDERTNMNEKDIEIHDQRTQLKMVMRMEMLKATTRKRTLRRKEVLKTLVQAGSVLLSLKLQWTTWALLIICSSWAPKRA